MNSTDDSRFLVLGQTYLYWLANEVFPYLFGSFCILQLITGVVLNIIITLMYKKHRKDDTFLIGVHFILSDFVSYVAILLPSAYISFTSTESISSAVCGILGVLTNAVFLFHFGLVTVVFVFVIMSGHHKQSSLFPRRLIILTSSLVLVLMTIAFAAVPIFTGDKFIVQTPEHRCGLEREKMKPYVNGMFGVYFMSFIAATITLFITIRQATQHRKDKKERDDSTHGYKMEETIDNENTNEPTNEESKQTNFITVAGAGNDESPRNDGENEQDLPEKEEDSNENTSGEERPITGTDIDVVPANSTTLQDDNDNVKQRKSSSEDSKFALTSPTFRLSSSEEESGTLSGTIPKMARKYREVRDILIGETPTNLHTRNSVVYLLTWLIMFLCWCPYVVFTYVVMYGSLWWDGWLSVAVCLGYLSYCTKPIVLLTIRKDLRKKSSDILPQSVKQKAGKVGSRLSKVF